MSNVVPFRDPSLPLEGIESLAARRAFRAGCKIIAEAAIGKAFCEAAKIPGAEKLGINDAHPIFVAAMRRELRRSGLF